MGVLRGSPWEDAFARRGSGCDPVWEKQTPRFETRMHFQKGLHTSCFAGDQVLPVWSDLL